MRSATSNSLKGASPTGAAESWRCVCGPGVHEHGCIVRYWRSRSGGGCANGLVCSDCLRAGSEYRRALKRFQCSALPVDDVTVRDVAQHIHNAVSWNALAAEAGTALRHYQTVYRPRVQSLLIALAEQASPTPEGAPKHGTLQRYRRAKCRCEPCRYACTLDSRRRATTGQYGRTTDATAVRDHLVRLLSQGGDLEMVAQRSGVDAVTLQAYLLGHRNRIYIEKARRVLAVGPKGLRCTPKDGRRVRADSTRVVLAALADNGWTRRGVATALGRKCGEFGPRGETVFVRTAVAVRTLWESSPYPPPWARDRRLSLTSTKGRSQ